MRDPVRTRQALLLSAFEEMHCQGFRGADISSILKSAGVTKGALYHHFESKETLGYAVVAEVIADIMREKWLLPLRNARDPIDAIIGILQGTSFESRQIRCGCPLNNISQEMSGLDEGFRERTESIFREWHRAIAKAFQDGKEAGLLASHVDPDEASAFLIASYEGYISLAKTFRDAEWLKSGMAAITRYLYGLRLSTE